jgi:hypothetical protein
MVHNGTPPPASTVNALMRSAGPERRRVMAHRVLYDDILVLHPYRVENTPLQPLRPLIADPQAHAALQIGACQCIQH